MRAAGLIFFVLGVRLSSQQTKLDFNYSVSRENERQGCRLPASPAHGTLTSPVCQTNSSLPGCQGLGATVPDFWLLEFSCGPGYRLPKNANIYYSRCFGGVWAPVPPVCLAEKVAIVIAAASLPKPTSKLITGGCLLPQYPNNGRYYTFSCTNGASTDPGCQYIPGTPVPPAWTLTYTCNPGYVKNFVGGRIGQYARCSNGTWDVNPPMCIKHCPPLNSNSHSGNSMVFRCFNGPAEVECSQPAVPGTVASYQCKDLYTRDPQDSVKLLSCLSDGAWTYQPPPCQPSCGLSSIDSDHPRIIDGEKSPLGFFPWHGGVYQSTPEGSWSQVCGGTLIKSNVFLTAAFCVVTEGKDRTIEVMRPSELRVALGKYYRRWDRTEPTEVKREIVKVEVPLGYKGSSTNFESDIALLLLDGDVPLSRLVMPVCLDPPQLPSNNKLGYITGWGNSEQIEPSETVLYCSWPFQDYDACFHNMVQKDSYISADKFCAGVEVHAAARKSIGGGFSHVINRKHYIQGILSSLVVRRSEVEYLRDLNYPVFTNISHPTHHQWITTTIDRWMYS